MHHRPLSSQVGNHFTPYRWQRSVIMLLSGLLLVLYIPSRLVTSFAQTNSELPPGLTQEDWTAIHALLPQTISQQAYLKASNTEAGDSFGYSVAIWGDTVVVGTPDESSASTGVDGILSDNSALYAGAAFVFVRIGTMWETQAYLKASNTDAFDAFGNSVAIYGNTIVIGAPGEDSAATGINGDQANNAARDAGAAYVFTRKGTTWSQQAYLKASNTDAGDFFGTYLAIFEDTIISGVAGEASAATTINGDQSDNTAYQAGAAYVFERTGTTWSQQAYLKASNAQAGDQFGRSVSITGDTVVVGAPGEASAAAGVDADQSNNAAPNAGAAYVFRRSGTIWTQQAYLKASNPDAADRFGWELSSSDTMIAVGAFGEASAASGVNADQTSNTAPNAGAVYVFVRSGTTWEQQAYLKASNADAEDNFGVSLAISGERIIVGAWRESSNATGIDGNQRDNSALNAGAAYLFARSGTLWTQQAYIKGFNTEVADRFSYGLGFSGNTIVAGAFGEDSAAFGVDGNGDNNLASSSGAAYVLEIMEPATPTATATMTPTFTAEPTTTATPPNQNIFVPLLLSNAGEAKDLFSSPNVDP